MSYSLTQIVLFIVAYLTVLFGVAYLADRGTIPKKITHHPAVYVLSLGVFAGAMATNGTIALAYNYGYSFLLYYLGAVMMFVMATVLLMPLLRLCRIYQLSSLADVLTFRFRSQRVGAAITIAMCLTLLPLLALQIQVVANSINILAGGTNFGESTGQRQDGLALLFCIIIIVFSILFGTRHVSSQYRNTGLVTAIAFESLVKLAALFILFFASIYGVFGGFSGLEDWLAQRPAIHNILDRPMRGDTARSLLLIFFAGAVCMPHIFHMTFAENTDSRDLHTSAWGLPLYLMLLSLPILPVTWAGIKLEQSLPLEYTGLAIGLILESTHVSVAAFVAGLSAASATIIVTTLALANMCVNHLVLPLHNLQIDPTKNLYTQLKWMRRSFITLLILGGYVFHLVISGKESLSQLALVAFIGTLQFLPGVVATLYWPAANRKGLLTGLGAGLTVWFLSMLLPVFSNFEPNFLDYFYPTWMGDIESIWTAATMVSLAINTVLFAVVSLLTPAHAEEVIAADICSMDDLNRPTRQLLSLHSPSEFAEQLANALGEKAANDEIRRALADLQFNSDESRPYALRRLRNRIEANLSGLLGPAVAHSILTRCIPFRPELYEGTEDINLIERNLDRAQMQFTGMAADLDNLRRHYRQTLNKLPIGVCSLGSYGELLMWNRAMENITGISSQAVLGSLLDSLPQPWCDILTNFAAGEADSVMKHQVGLSNSDDKKRGLWVSLHRAAIAASANRDSGSDTEYNEDRVILVEDISHSELLEEELIHSERLASIGRLAAGVAHEIGNPVTGIACLAQNLEYETEPAEIRHMAHDILAQTDRVSRIVESLVNFSHTGSKSGETRLSPSNLADCVDEAINLLQLDHQAKPVRFNNHCDRELVVLADSQRLLQVFINLLGNARHACQDEGHVSIVASRDGDLITTDIEDNGCGVPPHLLTQVFEPFFTTKDPGEGTGLGLALVYSIMEDMNGSVHLKSPLSEGEFPGTRVSLQLPSSTYTAAFLV
ncbi:MAG: signal transduction histidine kinase/Na+/proline symporter [Halioglobus sp.]|jgi:signal transduction histidine kinase/Na+/proline symporter